MSQAQDSSRPDDDGLELERAAQLLDRTVHFLERCVEDPQAAMQSDDPRALIQGLRALAAQPPSAAPSVEPAPESRTIPIRHRRSA